MNKNFVLVAATVIFQEIDGKLLWFIAKEAEGEDWTFPKVIVRKGESSVRAALRMVGQKASMSTRVLEEIGRTGGVTTLNGKTVPRRYIYYLMVARHVGTEAIGFVESEWCDYAKAAKKLISKTDLAMLKDGRQVLKDWKKEHDGRGYDEDDEEESEFPEEPAETPAA
jgi:ADP-ribose pyrophosphatase YjhB (NUDIX family)